MDIQYYKNAAANLEQVKAEFPTQFANPMDRFSYGWPDGWHDLVRRVCLRAAKVCPGVQWLQIKEKYASLRMYREGGRFQGSIHLEGRGVLIVDGAVEDELDLILDAVREESRTTCMCCGKTQVAAVHDDGWWVTLCFDCTALLKRPV